MIKDIPFVSNTSDDKHCIQASYMMIAKYFDSSFDIAMDEWARLTGFEEGKGTWAAAGLLWFKENGYEVRHVSLFDYEEFVRRPEGYLYEIDGDKVGQWAIEHTNIPSETKRITKLLASGIIEQREPTINDIKSYMDNGYLVRINVNSSRLAGRDGYNGHAVTVVGFDDTWIILHDPGLPAYKNRKVTYEQLEAAWADPTAEMKELDAVKSLHLGIT